MEIEIELTKKQLERQDFVDNAIFDLIKELIPEDKAENLQWDIEMIAEVREEIENFVVGRKNLISEEEFYPCVKTIKTSKSD